MTNDPSIVEEFVVESLEQLDNVEADFRQLGSRPGRTGEGVVDNIFRAVHSIKGGAGFLQFGTVRVLAHAMETVLSFLRSGRMDMTPEIAGTLCGAAARLRALVSDSGRGEGVDLRAEMDGLEGLLPSVAGGGAAGSSGVRISEEGPLAGFDISALVQGNLPGSHGFLYVLKYDLNEIGKDPEKTPVALIRQLLSTGEIVDARLQLPEGAGLDSSPDGPLLYEVLYSTILEPGLIDLAVGLPRERILSVDRKLLPGGGNANGARNTGAAPGKPSASAPAAEPDGPDESGGQAELSFSPAYPPFSDDEFDLPITPEMIEQFIVECDEMLERVEQCFCDVRTSPESATEAIEEAYRHIHSIKGNSGLLAIKDYEEISHRMESLLDFLRRDVSLFDTQAERLLLRGVDAIRGALPLLGKGERTVEDKQAVITALDRMGQYFKANEPLPAALAGDGDAGRGEHGGDVGGSGEREDDEAGDISESIHKRLERRDIRVDLDKLDVLIDLVGELVIAESMVTGHPGLPGLELEGFERSVHNLRRIISDLQGVAMAVRMIPLSQTFRRMIRLVHDVSGKAGKLVRLTLVGEDTEVDKTVIEQISDPLVHLVRNCVDHGIEPPRERLSAGKVETGEIVIQARHEGGEVLIQIRDDGRGLDRVKILRKAAERHLVRGDGASMPDEDVFKIVFEPGFSTAEKVTDVSGRGVGMDVVRRNLEALGGRVEIRSVGGEGTVISLYIPLTLAIIDGMLVRVGASRYTIPLLGIRESFRPEPGQINTTMDGQEIVSVRDEIIPVVRLSELHGKRGDAAALTEGILIIVESGRRVVSLFVDELLGQHQTVIKGMPPYLGAARGLSGCTILGDGEVSLILDVAGIIQMAEETGEVARRREPAQ